MDRSTPFIAAVYAVIVMMLAIMGYKQAGSTISLVSGTSMGVLLLICLYFIMKRKTWAFVLGTVVTALLLVVFCIRFGVTSSFMPGAMAVFSMIVLVLLLGRTIHAIRKK